MVAVSTNTETDDTAICFKFWIFKSVRTCEHKSMWHLIKWLSVEIVLARHTKDLSLPRVRCFDPINDETHVLLI